MSKVEIKSNHPKVHCRLFIPWLSSNATQQKTTMSVENGNSFQKEED